MSSTWRNNRHNIIIVFYLLILFNTVFLKCFSRIVIARFVRITSKFLLKYYLILSVAHGCCTRAIRRGVSPGTGPTDRTLRVDSAKKNTNNNDNNSYNFSWHRYLLLLSLLGVYELRECDIKHILYGNRQQSDSQGRSLYSIKHFVVCTVLLSIDRKPFKNTYRCTLFKIFLSKPAHRTTWKNKTV